MELGTDNQISKYNTLRREVFAKTLDFTSKTGLLFLTLCFMVYALGVFEAHIPADELLSLSSMSASEFMEATGYRGGWSWINLIHKSDYMNYLAIALLASATLISNISLLPCLIREKDKKLAAICLVQIIVIILSASGFIRSGH